MIRSTIFILTTLASYLLNGQNLISNGSFESAWCGRQFVGNQYCDWIKPPQDMGTPDGFRDYSSSNCYPCNCLSGQNTFAGDTYARTGKNFIGVVGYYIQGGQKNGRENIQQELQTPLVAGQTYHIGFSIKLGERSKYEIDHFGLYISDTALGPSNLYPLNDLINVTPQLDISRSLTADTVWRDVSGLYTASGGERFVTLGNFTPDSMLSINPNPSYISGDTTCLLTNFAGYVFIDDIYIIPDSTISVSELPMIEFSTYPNPATNHLVVKFHGDLNKTSVLIFNSLGEKVLDQTLIEKESFVLLNELGNGIYTIQLKIEGRIIQTERLIILK